MENIQLRKFNKIGIGVRSPPTFAQNEQKLRRLKTKKIEQINVSKDHNDWRIKVVVFFVWNARKI